MSLQYSHWTAKFVLKFLQIKTKSEMCWITNLHCVLPKPHITNTIASRYENNMKREIQNIASKIIYINVISILCQTD